MEIKEAIGLVKEIIDEEMIKKDPFYKACRILADFASHSEKDDNIKNMLRDAGRYRIALEKIAERRTTDSMPLIDDDYEKECIRLDKRIIELQYIAKQALKGECEKNGRHNFKLGVCVHCAKEEKPKSEVCLTCAGKGFNLSDPFKSKCMKCNGTGEVNK